MLTKRNIYSNIVSEGNSIQYLPINIKEDTPMKRTIHIYNTNPRTPGKRGIHKKASRKDLERTLLDMLTMSEDVDFCEAQEIVEELATYEELIELIWKLENGFTSPEAVLETYGF